MAITKADIKAKIDNLKGRLHELEDDYSSLSGVADHEELIAIELTEDPTRDPSIPVEAYPQLRIPGF